MKTRQDTTAFPGSAGVSPASSLGGLAQRLPKPGAPSDRSGGTAASVAQIFNLLYRRILFCGRPTFHRPPESPVRLPIKNQRPAPKAFGVQRLKICATPARHGRTQAFTMIEIAISLAIIGFALVAIIGILPTGMNAQRDNRQETIVNQDASILMDAVRNGERGVDDLTNYVVGITNYVGQYNRVGQRVSLITRGYSVQGSTVNGVLGAPQFPLTNGYSIIGLLSTPKIIPQPSGFGFFSNHVVAVFRSLSGPANEKAPQANPIMQDLGLTYRLICDVSGYGTNFFDRSWTNYGAAGLSTNDIAMRSNYMVLVQNLQTNLHDLRLTFRWPLLPNGNLGAGRQVYRTMVAGRYTNDPPGSPFWFVQPRTYF